MPAHVSSERPHTASALQVFWPYAAATSLALFFFVTSVYLATKRLFWYDEIFSTITIRLPDFKSFWQALMAGVDPTAPGYLTIARVFDHLFGPAEFAIRLPSAIAVTAGLMLVFDTARRLSDGLHGLIAMCALLCSFLPYYGQEGRPYGMYFCFSAMALWSWAGRPSTPLFTLAMACGVAVHYYMVFCLVPFYLFEALTYGIRRRPSFRLLCGTAGALAVLGILAVQIISNRRVYGNNFWATPILYRVLTTYGMFFEFAPFLISMIVVGVVIAAHNAVARRPMGDGERLCWLFLSIPLFTFVAAKLITNAFYYRYFICVLPGVSVAFACLAWRHFAGLKKISVGIVILLGAFGALQQIRLVRSPERTFGDYQQQIRDLPAVEQQAERYGRHYLVLSSEMRYFEAQYYSKHRDRYILLQEQPWLVATVFPMHLWKKEELFRHATESVLVDADWDLLSRAQQRGFTASVRSVSSGPLVYLEH
jgi:hypothetical protein